MAEQEGWAGRKADYAGKQEGRKVGQTRLVRRLGRLTKKAREAD